MQTDSDNDKLTRVNHEISDYKTAVSDKERECIRLLDETLDVGSETLAELSVQGERLDKITDNLRKIESDIYSSEKTVTKMEWRARHPFMSLFFGRRIKKPTWWSSGSLGDENSSAESDNPALSVRHHGNKHNTDDKFVDTVQTKVDILKNMALNMGTELDRQNGKLTEIAAHTDHVSSHVDRTRDRVGTVDTLL
jgi:hypothetical protein